MLVEYYSSYRGVRLHDDTYLHLCTRYISCAGRAVPMAVAEHITHYRKPCSCEENSYQPFPISSQTTPRKETHPHTQLLQEISIQKHLNHNQESRDELHPRTKNTAGGRGRHPASTFLPSNHSANHHHNHMINVKKTWIYQKPTNTRNFHLYGHARETCTMTDDLNDQWNDGNIRPIT